VTSKQSKLKSKSKKTSEPLTMADLLASQDKKVLGFSVGQKIKAKVVAKNSKSLILDIGGKSEGVVAEKAFDEARDFIKGLKVGDEVTATVLVTENREGNVILSLRQATFDALWEKLAKARQAREPVAVIGKGVNPSGVTVEVEGLLGFIPGSQLGKETAKNSEELIGKHFKALVLEVDRLTNKIVLSEKEVSEAVDIKLAKEILAKIKEGDIYKGEVTTVANFGCFVKLDIAGKALSARLDSAKRAGRQESKAPIEGLVHISELSWGKVGSTSDLVKVGDKVKVKVIGVKDSRLSLSIKQAQKDPWSEVEDKFKVESKFKGKVTRVSDFGIFVELIPGVEGLVHITKIPPTKKFSEGQEIECFIEEIDSKNKKIALGLVLTEKPIGYK